MASDQFRSFLSTVAEKLFPEDDVEILSPESPPDWRKLGWKAGFIVEDGHTGLQWWLTDEQHWDALSNSFGPTNRVRKQTFARWYGGLINDLSRELGVPLSLESLRFRKMDLTAFEGRPLIEDEDWWSVQVGSDATGYWTLIVSERFMRVFEEDVESSPEPDPPWTFPELWEQLDDRRRRDILQQIGTDEGLLNHLGSLVVSGVMDYETIAERMARQPREEFERVVDRRREELQGTGSGRRDQTLDRWQDDAIEHLTRRIGQWLESDELPAERWANRTREWNEYRREVLEETFGASSWIALWENLSLTDRKQLIPRLNLSLLGKSLGTLSRADREEILEGFPDDLAIKLREGSFSAERREALEAREELFEQGETVIQSMDYELEGHWNPKSD